jgi:hypothetical protein
MDRRRASDDRKRLVGCVRLNVWVQADRIKDLEALIDTWQFADRAQAVDIAIRFLSMKTPTLDRLEL